MHATALLRAPAWWRDAGDVEEAHYEMLAGDEEEDDAVAPDNNDGEDDEQEERDDAAALDIGVLLEAMGKCVAFYHQTNKIEFYAMVAEEYGMLQPEREEVSVEAIEEMEPRLHRIAIALANGSDDADEVDMPREIEPHAGALLAFYKALGGIETSPVDHDDHEQASEGHNTANEDDAVAAPESPHAPVQSPAGLTDGSASNPVTPQEDHAEESSAAATENGLVIRSEPLPQTQPASEAAASTTTGSTDARSSQFTFGYATCTLADLTRANVESKQRLRDAEEQLKREKAITQQKKSEYKALKAIVKEYRQRDDEKKRLQLLLTGDDSDADGSDADSKLSVQEMKKLLRKEAKRAKRLQENLSLKFQLLQSENERYRMKTEQQMAELRNEYTDSYVFGP